MTDEQLKAAVGLFLKHIDATAQREIEKAIRKAIKSGALRRSDSCLVGIRLLSDQLELDATIYSKIVL